ncbi:MAG TPA: gamma carbonic anhydrase family protein [Candidatus Coatesbacteria bacterium]|nr:gamma carbonic anhydrase family protein [Candidatus Coatesbacteria bacterium]
MPLRPYQGKAPELDPTVFVAPSAELIGSVRLAVEASVWFGCLLRADIAPIEIGERTNIQDLTVIHVDTGQPTIIGADVTVGHRAILHACTIGDGCLVGMGAIILNGAEIGEGALIGAGALIPPRRKVPPGAMVLGAPGQVVRRLTPAEIEGHKRHAAGYVELAKSFIEEGL